MGLMIQLHDWHRMYKTGHTYMGRELWRYVDRFACDCATSGNPAKPKQHGADPHAKNCRVYAEGHLRG